MDTTNKSNLRIHPAIGIARVGTSLEYYLGPETMAAERLNRPDGLNGGLPINPDTEDFIKSTDLRDSDGNLKRQAARFKIYQYKNEGSTYSYPSTAESEEVVLGSVVDGKKVTQIIWTAHLANKKANCWVAEAGSGDNVGINVYKQGQMPPLRNPDFLGKSPDFNDPARLLHLVIDAGPRAIVASSNLRNLAIRFDKTTNPSYYDAARGQVVKLAYPVSFPASDGGDGDYNLTSKKIEYLGEIQTDEKGRLIVLGGFGRACGFDNQGKPNKDAKLDDDVDCNNWLDDTSDGPVTAVLVFEDGSTRALEGSAWVITTDPAYAPQTLNVVSLWENVYTTWLEHFNLDTNLYNNGVYNPQYTPSFKDDVFPIFNAAHMQRWNTNLNRHAIDAHSKLMDLEADPAVNQFPVLNFIRKPNDPAGQQNGNTLMPLSLGNSGKSFLTVTPTQYFFLEQWWNGKCKGVAPRKLSAGEQLDKTMMVNSLGGRFSPGIEATFILTDTNIYNPDWKNPAIGTFRINGKPMDYKLVSLRKPFLTVGYIPLRTNQVEPGDLCKFMAIPWHMDYNSCAIHAPSPNPGGALLNGNVNDGRNTSLFWSWPAQRPVAVYTYDDLKRNNGDLESDNMIQRFSVRGEGTGLTNNAFEPHSPPEASFKGAAMEVGRYQDRSNMLKDDNWHRIGTIIQGPAIKDYAYDKDYYLEVQSLFKEDKSNLVQPWGVEGYKATDPVFDPPKTDPIV